MMEINLVCLLGGDACFRIQGEGLIYTTSRSISELLDLSVNDYNNILIEKVIQHTDFKATTFGSVYKDLFIDVTFQLNNISSKIYIERFKEAFAPQLMLIKIGGFENDRS